MNYSHTQVGTVMIIGFLIPLIGVGVLPAFIGISPAVVFVVLGGLIVALAMFGSLNVQIEGGTLLCSFGIGVIRRSIPLNSVTDVKAVRNSWLVGWGIRWIPGRCWVWNVSGLDAVELVFKDGSRFRIGTDEPEVLLKAILLNKVSAG